MTKSPREPLVVEDARNAPPYVQVSTPRFDDVALAVKKTEENNTKTTKSTSGDSDVPGAKDKAPATPPVPLSQLYRYATPRDKLSLAFGMLCAGINGALFPGMALLYGDAISAFKSDGSVDMDTIEKASLEFFLVAVALFVTDYVSYVVFVDTAERQMKALREEALRHMLYMDVTWFDSNDALQLSSRLTGDTVKIKDGMGSKLGDAFKYTIQFFTGFIIGFSRGWELTLVMSCVMPMMALSLGWLIKMLRSRSEHSQKMYAEAGAVAEETLSSIRTVVSLNGEKRAIDRYNDKALAAEGVNLQLAKYSSAVFGLFFGSIWVMYAAGLWYGGARVVAADMTPAKVFQAFFGVLMGTISLAQVGPSVSSVAEARGAAGAIYKILDTPLTIDASKDDGVVPAACLGHIQAIDLHFAYPTRPDAPILKGYNVNIEAGQTVAFVGASGGGKSTLIALLERFYNPQSGQILLDGRDITTLNIGWLRSQIGMVSQEPVLFARTIYENIAAGGNDITREQAIEAAKMANAHNFIMTLPQQYDTLVGEKGVSLSGGQKQRVAIARAVVRNPKILVLDEATSALDAESERIVQDALNDLMDKTKMTTLVIAHRLSTVRHADKIVVLSGGRVVEEGKHDELLAIQDGVYSHLYTTQDEKATEELAVATEAKSVVQLRRTSSHLSTGSAQDYAAFADEEQTPKNKFTLRDAMAFSSPDRRFFIVGTLAAAITGFGLPLSALLISQLVTSMTLKYDGFLKTGDHSLLNSLSDEVTKYGLCYVGGSVAMFVFTAIQSYCFRYMAEKLTSRMRDINFTALCRQNIAFFDDKKHGTGALTADLATNATKVSLILGLTLGRLIQCIFTFVAALVISFTTGSWLLSLIMLAVFPFLVFGQVARSRQIAGAEGLADELADVGAHASEALSNIRTVVSLGLETTLTKKFASLLEMPLKQSHKEAQINGVALGFSSFIVFAAYAFMFWYGGKLVDNRDITFLQMMRTLMAIMMSVQGAGAAGIFMSESDKAVKACAAIVALRDRQLPIDSFDEGGLRPPTVEGKIEFKDITFRYPTRPGVTVLKHYNLTVEAGQTVAFCGPSGGGKSTCIAMIERFYDPVEGQITLDGHDLKDINIQWLRSQIGLVGQEPTLFIGTIADNIAYGLEVKPSHEEIEAAARMANAHDFITQFPDGYETQVGNKGEQLSGGQKQRIAIARAILKNPNVLLLDEATSALDSESEKIVQEALDKVVALKRRTTIIIAHRLSTIRKADKICVVSGGRIAEAGTHAELLAMGGIYKKLVESAAA